MPLLVGLPLRMDTFDDAAARAFFAGLLPEGRLRDLIAQQFHLSRQNDFGLLDQLGGVSGGGQEKLTNGKMAIRDFSVDWTTRNAGLLCDKSV